MTQTHTAQGGPQGQRAPVTVVSNEMGNTNILPAVQQQAFQVGPRSQLKQPQNIGNTNIITAQTVSNAQQSYLAPIPCATPVNTRSHLQTSTTLTAMDTSASQVHGSPVNIPSHHTQYEPQTLTERVDSQIGIEFPSSVTEVNQLQMQEQRVISASSNIPTTSSNAPIAPNSNITLAPPTESSIHDAPQSETTNINGGVTRSQSEMASSNRRAERPRPQSGEASGQTQENVPGPSRQDERSNGAGGGGSGINSPTQPTPNRSYMPCKDPEIARRIRLYLQEISRQHAKICTAGYISEFQRFRNLLPPRRGQCHTETNVPTSTDSVVSPTLLRQIQRPLNPSKYKYRKDRIVEGLDAVSSSRHSGHLPNAERSNGDLMSGSRVEQSRTRQEDQSKATTASAGPSSGPMSRDQPGTSSHPEREPLPIPSYKPNRDESTSESRRENLLPRIERSGAEQSRSRQEDQPKATTASAGPSSGPMSRDQPGTSSHPEREPLPIPSYKPNRGESTSESRRENLLPRIEGSRAGQSRSRQEDQPKATMASLASSLVLRRKGQPRISWHPEREAVPIGKYKSDREGGTASESGREYQHPKMTLQEMKDPLGILSNRSPPISPVASSTTRQPQKLETSTERVKGRKKNVTSSISRRSNHHLEHMPNAEVSNRDLTSRSRQYRSREGGSERRRRPKVLSQPSTSSVPPPSRKIQEHKPGASSSVERTIPAVSASGASSPVHRILHSEHTPGRIGSAGESVDEVSHSRGSRRGRRGEHITPTDTSTGSRPCSKRDRDESPGSSRGEESPLHGTGKSAARSRHLGHMPSAEVSNGDLTSGSSQPQYEKMKGGKRRRVSTLESETTVPSISPPSRQTRENEPGTSTQGETSLAVGVRSRQRLTKGSRSNSSRPKPRSKQATTHQAHSGSTSEAVIQDPPLTMGKELSDVLNELSWADE